MALRHLLLAAASVEVDIVIAVAKEEVELLKVTPLDDNSLATVMSHRTRMVSSSRYSGFSSSPLVMMSLKAREATSALKVIDVSVILPSSSTETSLVP